MSGVFALYYPSVRQSDQYWQHWERQRCTSNHHPQIDATRMVVPWQLRVYKLMPNSSWPDLQCAIMRRKVALHKTRRRRRVRQCSVESQIMDLAQFANQPVLQRCSERRSEGWCVAGSRNNFVWAISTWYVSLKMSLTPTDKFHRHHPSLTGMVVGVQGGRFRQHSPPLN